MWLLWTKDINDQSINRGSSFLTSVVVNGQRLFPHPENCFYSLWLWEKEMERDNTLLADTLLTLQMQQELVAGKGC